MVAETGCGTICSCGTGVERKQWSGGSIDLLCVLLYPFILTFLTVRDCCRCIYFYSVHTNPFHALYQTWVRCTKAVFYTVVSGWALSSTFGEFFRYVYFVLPWWLHNKLIVDMPTACIHEVLKWVTRDEVLLEFLKEHDESRLSGIEDKAYQNSFPRLSVYGGAFIAQYCMWGSDEVFANHDEQEFIAAAMHVFDDYADQDEDRLEDRSNYFLHVPNPMPIEDWLKEVRIIQSRHVGDKMGRYIDGCLWIVTMFNEDLRSRVALEWGTVM